MHLGQRHDQGELVVLHVELEQVPPPNDLEAGQHNAPEVHVGDEDVAGDLADVVEEGEVQVLVLQPGQLQVAVNVGAVRVSGKRNSIITLIIFKKKIKLDIKVTKRIKISLQALFPVLRVFLWAFSPNFLPQNVEIMQK